MEVYGKDAIIGDFRLSDYGLILASFSSDTSSSETIGFDTKTNETYVSDNPIPVYTGFTYSEKLKPTMVIIKNPCMFDSLYFTEHECRDILRNLTGFRGYKYMQIENDSNEEELYYKVRTTSVGYERNGQNVIGINIVLECDSMFAWSREYTYPFNIKAGQGIVLFNNSDDLYNYLLPQVEIVSSTVLNSVTLTNKSDNNWETTFTNFGANEIINMDSKLYIVKSSNIQKNIGDMFNMHFIRLVPGRNEITSNQNIKITFRFRLPRKVGFV